MKRVLITGITGQDGSYLAELLLAKGYEVHGLVRRTSGTAARIAHVADRLHLHDGDLSAASLAHVLREAAPDEVYHLASQSHVGTSFAIPDVTGEVTGLGVVRLLEAIRQSGRRDVRFYQASTSELFGASPPPQSESTPFRPRSPYAAAKLYAFWSVVNYREAYGLYACNGILFNHESPRRSEDFVTRKITRAAARIKAGLQGQLRLGNLDARRDWGFAGDYVEAMWRMLQRDAPADYVIATGETHSVREFVAAAFSRVGLDWEEHVVVDPRFFRPTEVEYLCGDARRAREDLGWSPLVSFQALVEQMVDADLKEVAATR